MVERVIRMLKKQCVHRHRLQTLQHYRWPVACMTLLIERLRLHARAQAYTATRRLPYQQGDVSHIRQATPLLHDTAGKVRISITVDSHLRAADYCLHGVASLVNEGFARKPSEFAQSMPLYCETKNHILWYLKITCYCMIKSYKILKIYHVEAINLYKNNSFPEKFFSCLAHLDSDTGMPGRIVLYTIR